MTVMVLQEQQERCRNIDRQFAVVVVVCCCRCLLLSWASDLWSCLLYAYSARLASHTLYVSWMLRLFDLFTLFFSSEWHIASLSLLVVFPGRVSFLAARFPRQHTLSSPALCGMLLPGYCAAQRLWNTIKRGQKTWNALSFFPRISKLCLLYCYVGLPWRRWEMAC